MDKPYNILLLDDSCPLKKILNSNNLSGIDEVICLFWINDKTERALENRIQGKCLGLKHIIGNLEKWEKKASDLSYGFCSQGPVYKGLFCREMLLESVYREALYFQVFEFAITYMKKRVFSEKRQKISIFHYLSEKSQKLCRHLMKFYKIKFSFNPFLEQEQKITNDSGNKYVLRLAKRVKEILFTGGLKIHLWHVLAELDKTYEFRCKCWPNLKKTGLAKNRIIFFSSYFNNSRSFKAIETHLSKTPHWIFLNESARQGALPLRSSGSWVWNFSGNSKKEFPSEDRLDFSRNQDEICFAKWIAKGPIWKYWKDFGLKSLANITYCWENILTKSSPEFVFVANQWGIEGWIIKITKLYGIPTIQLMHGVFSGYFYTKTPVLSDAMITYGEFWRSLWPEKQRSKIFVYNPGHIKPVKKQKHGNQPTITFFSWPLKQLNFYNFDEFYSNMAEIIHYFISKRVCQWIIRFHPFENPEDFVKLWSEKYGKIPDNLKLSKREPLADILERTDIAIMFRSTVMLDCMASKIPAIIPGWVDFGWNHKLEGHKGIYLVKDMQEIKNIIINCLDNPPEIKPENFLSFLNMPGRSFESLESILQFTKGIVKNAEYSG